jgi:hypothetical protein
MLVCDLARGADCCRLDRQSKHGGHRCPQQPPLVQPVTAHCKVCPLGCKSMWAPHLTRLETQTKESDMHASRRVLKPGMHKEDDEREFLTARTAG